MSRILALAAHEVVQWMHPRPPRPEDTLGRAVGKAIDSALSQFSYESAVGKRPTVASAARLGRTILDEELEGAEVEVLESDRKAATAELEGVIQAFRRSGLLGTTRPKTRLILIDGRVGVFAQPDYWDGKGRIYEMKSYSADPTFPDINLQLQLFQLAFPGFETILACFDRKRSPVPYLPRLIPPISPADGSTVLRAALECGLAHGTEKVTEFLDNPIIPYELPPGT